MQEWIAIALGLAIAVALAWFMFGLVGWLGVGLVGLIGLMISSRVALDDGRAVPDSDFGSTGVGIVARQIEEEHRIPPEHGQSAGPSRKNAFKCLIWIDFSACYSAPEERS